MTSRNITFRWTSDSSQLQSDFQTITANVKRVQRALLQLGRTGDAGNLAKVFDATNTNVKQAQQEIAKLQKALDTLQSKTAAARERGAGRGGVGPLTNELRKLAGIGAGRGAISFDEAEAGAARLEAAIRQIEAAIAAWQDELQVFNADLARANQLAVSIRDVGQGAFQRRVETAASPAAFDASIQERINQLEAARVKLLERQAAIRQRVFDQIDPESRSGEQDRLNRLTQQEGNALERIQQIQAERAGVEKRLNDLGSQRLRIVLEQLRQGKSLSEIEQPALDESAQADLQRFTQLTEKLKRAQDELFTAQQRAAKPGRQFGFTLGRLDLAGEFEDITKVISDLDAQIAGFSGPGRLDEINKIAPTLLGNYRQLISVTEKYNQVSAKLADGQERSAAATDKLNRRQAQLAKRQRELVLEVEKGQRQLRERGVPQILNFEDIEAQLGTLERTLIGAFRGFGRRFQATLQFALSAGLIFGVQRFLREFVDTAIEVERAFEDIATALEFDIEAPRGSIEFRRELELIRRDVLEVANEFNVLPTVANEVAFKMVARFQDMGNAVQATRAQMLALKISTIETDEVLRALTATAEAFANEVLESEQALSLQERLLIRENAAIKNYAEALDLATVIQQKWGVDFEDTIEGVARAGPTFRNLGFSLQETAAIVASATRVLPGTGIQIAERLVRAFGAFSSDEIRDELLSFASQTENLTLTLLDFEQGGKFALQSIQSQIDQLDPKELVELQQIIGQRREIEVVSAVLGTAPLQEDINNIADATGAAERRFAFLEQTTRELINSLTTQFQELAQNLERIGLLSPFKILLQTGGALLGVINSILKGIVDIIQALNSIPILKDIGLGDLLSTTLALGLALRSVLATLEAIGGAQGALGGTGVLVSVAGGAAPGQQVGRRVARESAGVVAAGLTIRGLRALGETAQKITGTLGRAFARVTDGLFFFARTLVREPRKIVEAVQAFARRIALAGTGTRSGPPLLAGGARSLGILALLAGLGTAIFSTINAFKANERALADQKEALEESQRAIRAEAAARGASPEETRLDLIQAEFDLVRDRQPVGGGIGNFFASRFLPDLEGVLNDNTLVRQILRFNDISEQALTDSEARAVLESLIQEAREGDGRDGGALFPPELFLEQSEQRNVAESAARFEDLVRAQIEEFNESFNQLDFTGQFQASGIRAGFQDVLRQVSEATSPEEILALVPLFQSYAAAWLDLKTEQNLTLEGVEGTLKDAQDKVSRTSELVSIGIKSFDQGIAEVQEQIESLQQLAADTSDPDTRDEILSGITQFREQQAQFIQARIQEQQAINDATRTEEAALRSRITELQEAIRELEATGNIRAANQLRVELLNAQKALNDFLIARIRTQSQIARQFADTPEETLQILREEMRALVNAALRTFNPQIIAQVAEIVVEMQAQIRDIKRDIESRGAVASARATGPVLSTLNQLKADLIGLRIDLSRVDEASVVAIEIRNQIAQNLAQQHQELFRRAAAATLLQAGVNNSIRKLKAQITITAKELDLTAKLFGEQSAEFLELQLKQDELQNELANALLELRDINRRLDSGDITNTLEQAQLDLLAIMEKLQAPDLGPLEKARLELEKRNAEAAAQQAFFDDRLFQLRFSFETGEIGTAAYIGALEQLLSTVDTSTQQGKEIFLQIQGIIDGLTDDVSSLAFNIPTNIRLPTIFEIRRSLAADQLGVNYVDNRQQEINLTITDQLTLEQVLAALDSRISSGAARVPAGAAGITIGAF